MFFSFEELNERKLVCRLTYIAIFHGRSRATGTRQLKKSELSRA